MYKYVLLTEETSPWLSDYPSQLFKGTPLEGEGYALFHHTESFARGVETELNLCLPGVYPYSISTISVNFTSFLNILKRFIFGRPYFPERSGI
jgi:hypothetical protein